MISRHQARTWWAEHKVVAMEHTPCGDHGEWKRTDSQRSGLDVKAKALSVTGDW